MAKNELVSLALLKVSPLHAYALNAVLEQMKVEQWAQVSRASIYASLKRLESRGSISVTLEKPDNMPERKVFNITKKGEDELYEEFKYALSTPEKSGPTLFYLGVSFLVGISSTDAIEWVSERIKTFEQVVESITEDIIKMKEIECDRACLILQTALHHTEIEIKASRDFIQLVKDKPDNFNKPHEVCKSIIEDTINGNIDKECK